MSAVQRMHAQWQGAGVLSTGHGPPVHRAMGLCCWGHSWGRVYGGVALAMQWALWGTAFHTLSAGHSSLGW